MKASKYIAIDPICGMTVDKATAFYAERDGEKFCFCSDHCRQTFLSAPAGAILEQSLEASADNFRTLSAK
ncbi:MAG: YHS domain-containing protein [Opitutus sp.]